MSYLKEDSMSGIPLNLNERNFRVAFTVESYLSPESKNDPKYVKYLVNLHGRRNGVAYRRVLSYHKCTNEEYDEFYPVKPTQAHKLKDIWEDPERGMFCIDWNDDDPIEITGHELDSDYTAFDVLLVPCNYIHTMFNF